MQGIDWKPLTSVINLPCTKVLSFDTRNVLSGVLNAAEHDKDWNDHQCYQDAVMCLDTIHVSIPHKVTIEQMMIGLRQMVRAGLLIEHGVRYKLSGLLAVQYADYVATHKQEVA